MALQLLSPSKINLYLNVLYKREDGFHEIETLFERINLCDTLSFSKTSADIRLSVDTKSLPTNADNIIFKTAALLKDRFRIAAGVRIHLNKRIPISAGLGGGSGNAATTLLALNRLWKLKLSNAQVLRIASELGSDVAFFILRATNAIGTGRGEKLKKISLGAKKRWYCLIKPPFGISTKEAYGRLSRLRLTQPTTDVKMLIRSIQKGDAKSLAGLLNNSLELVLNNRVTEIKNIKEKLMFNGAKAALMSGSGSTVFGLYESKPKAEQAARKLRKINKTWQVFVASSL